MSEDFGIQIDDDWKAQARAEKERLSSKPAAAAPSPDPGTPAAGAAAAAASPTAKSSSSQKPKPDFRLLASTLASPAFYYLGDYADPQSGKRGINLEAARMHIDLLTVLEEKTRGGLSDEEAGMLSSLLYELRSRYIEVATAMTRTGVQR